MISGRTTVIGIIADPIEHVRTPQLFNALAADRGLDAVMVPLHVAPAGLARFMAGVEAAASVAGLVVTIPHKEAVLAYCSRQTEAARRVRAANVVRFDRLRGEVVASNTDGAGFLAGLRQHQIGVTGARVYIAGAGGAAKAIADALAEAGAATIGIHNRTRERAMELVQYLKTTWPRLDAHVASDAPDQYRLAVNATSLGLNPDDPLPFRVDRLAPDAIVAEVVMKTEITPLLAAAQARGLRVHPGRHMLEGQVVAIARFLRVLS